MRFWLLLFPCLLAAQESTTYTYDINGNRQVFEQSRTTQSANGSESVESVPSLNGGSVSMTKVDEQVIEDDANGHIVEHTITHNSGRIEKIRIEEHKQPGGVVATSTTVYRTDLNGSFQVAERSTSERSGGTTNTIVERPTINGSLETVEKKVTTEHKGPAGTRQDVVTYRKDDNGDFYEAVREITTRTEHNGVVQQTTDQYLDGKLNAQKVSTKRTNPDGSEVTNVSIYGMTAPGRPASDQSQLREQQQITRKRGADDTTVETFSVRRPSVDDTHDLGPWAVISQTVCSGCH